MSTRVLPRILKLNTFLKRTNCDYRTWNLNRLTAAPSRILLHRVFALVSHLCLYSQNTLCDGLCCLCRDIVGVCNEICAHHGVGEMVASADVALGVEGKK